MSADVDPSAKTEPSEAHTSRAIASSCAIASSSLDAATRDRFRRRALVVFSAALAIRLIALAVAGDAELVKDEIAYAARAEALLDGHGYLGSYQSWVRHEGWRIMDLPQYTGAYQPPGYPTFMAAVMAVSGRSLLAVKLVQCLLSALCCVWMLRLGHAWFGERVAWIASWIWALYPNAIAFSHLLWSETLFVFLLLALLDAMFGPRVARRGLAALADSPRGFPSPARCAAAGALLAMCALTRGTMVYLAPFLIFWMLLLENGETGLPDLRSLAWRRGLLRGAIVAGVALACIAPWTARNYAVHGGFVLIDTNAPYNLWRGNGPSAMALHRLAGAPHYDWPFDGVLLHPVGNLNGRELIDAYRRDHPGGGSEGGPALPSDLEIMSYASAVAWREICSDPRRALRHAGYKLVDMWNPTSFLIRHLELGAYGPVPSGLKAALVAAAAGSYLFVVVFAAMGAGRLASDRRVWLVLLCVVYFSAISALAFGLTRFRLPLMPLLMLLAAGPIARFGQAGRTLPGR